MTRVLFRCRKCERIQERAAQSKFCSSANCAGRLERLCSLPAPAPYSRDWLVARAMIAAFRPA